MHMSDGSEFPDACIRCVVNGKRPFAHRLQLFELRNTGLSEQSVVEERLCNAQHNLTVHIVLNVLRSLVATPDRT